MNQNQFQHYRKDEQQFAREIANVIEACSHKQLLKITDFLDPYKQMIVQDISNKYPDLACHFYGGFATAERKRALIIPDQWPYSIDDFKLGALQITSKDRDQKLKHGDFLGAILGQGVKREKVGDLAVIEHKCFVVLDQSLADFIMANLHQVHRSSVTVEELTDEQLPQLTEELTYVNNTVSSLRLDSILKIAYNMSRSKAAECIKRGMVKHNFSICENVTQHINVGDMISVRGETRVKILEISPPNKKGRIPVQIGRYR